MPSSSKASSKKTSSKKTSSSKTSSTSNSLAKMAKKYPSDYKETVALPESDIKKSAGVNVAQDNKTKSVDGSGGASSPDGSTEKNPKKAEKRARQKAKKAAEAASKSGLVGLKPLPAGEKQDIYVQNGSTFSRRTSSNGAISDEKHLSVSSNTEQATSSTASKKHRGRPARGQKILAKNSLGLVEPSASSLASKTGIHNTTKPDTSLRSEGSSSRYSSYIIQDVVEVPTAILSTLKLAANKKAMKPLAEITQEDIQAWQEEQKIDQDEVSKSEAKKPQKSGGRRHVPVKKTIRDGTRNFLLEMKKKYETSKGNKTVEQEEEEDHVQQHDQAEGQQLPTNQVQGHDHDKVRKGSNSSPSQSSLPSSKFSFSCPSKVDVDMMDADAGVGHDSETALSNVKNSLKAIAAQFPNIDKNVSTSKYVEDLTDNKVDTPSPCDRTETAEVGGNSGDSADQSGNDATPSEDSPSTDHDCDKMDICKDDASEAQSPEKSAPQEDSAPQETSQPSQPSTSSVDDGASEDRPTSTQHVPVSDPEKVEESIEKDSAGCPSEMPRWADVVAENNDAPVESSETPNQVSGEDAKSEDVEHEDDSQELEVEPADQEVAEPEVTVENGEASAIQDEAPASAPSTDSSADAASQESKNPGNFILEDQIFDNLTQQTPEVDDGTDGDDEHPEVIDGTSDDVKVPEIVDGTHEDDAAPQVDDDTLEDDGTPDVSQSIDGEDDPTAPVTPRKLLALPNSNAIPDNVPVPSPTPFSASVTQMADEIKESISIAKNALRGSTPPPQHTAFPQCISEFSKPADAWIKNNESAFDELKASSPEESSSTDSSKVISGAILAHFGEEIVRPSSPTVKFPPFPLAISTFAAPAQDWLDSQKSAFDVLKAASTSPSQEDPEIDQANGDSAAVPAQDTEEVCTPTTKLPSFPQAIDKFSEPAQEWHENQKSAHDRHMLSSSPVLSEQEAITEQEAMTEEEAIVDQSEVIDQTIEQADTTEEPKADEPKAIERKVTEPATTKSKITEFELNVVAARNTFLPGSATSLEDFLSTLCFSSTGVTTRTLIVHAFAHLSAAEKQLLGLPVPHSLIVEELGSPLSQCRVKIGSVSLFQFLGRAGFDEMGGVDVKVVAGVFTEMAKEDAVLSGGMVDFLKL